MSNESLIYDLACRLLRESGNQRDFDECLDEAEARIRYRIIRKPADEA